MSATRPKVTLFTGDEVDAVVADALRTLETVGVFIENDEALALLDGGGARVEGRTARIDEALVRRALATAPRRVQLFDRDGALACDLGGDAVHFDPGSAALFLLDPQTHRRREPTMTDLAHLAWIVEGRPHLAAQSTALVPADVPAVARDWARLHAALAHGRKPVVTGTFAKPSFAPMHAMLAAVRGGDEALRARPLAIFDCCPTPPLKWSDLTAAALIDAARAGVPAELISMPLAGATSPVTLREMVVQHAAETLSGVVIHQLAAPGAPVIYGGCPSAFDMRHGTTPMGAMETMMVEVGYAQIGKSFGLPTHAYMGLSDSKGLDWQAGMETGIGAVLAALAGINMVSGAGMLDFVTCQSFEKLVADDEACGMALRLARGIERHDRGSVAELIGEVVLSGHFLAHRDTRLHHRRELTTPGPVIDRATYGEWEKRGAPDSRAAARREVEKILAKGAPAPLDRERRERLDAIARDEAARAGFDWPA